MSRARKRAAAGVAAVAALGGGGALAAWGGGGHASHGPSRAIATALVERRNLVQSASVDGTLGYSGQRSLLGQLTGVVTSVPSAGDVVHRGHSLYALDHRRVLLLDGRLPAWRPLGPTVSDGADVRELEENLVVLGDDAGEPLTADGHWTAATTAAVKLFQKRTGLAQTGTLELGRIVFLPDPERRIVSVQAQLGQPAQPGQPVMTTTSLHRRVSVALAAEDAGAAHPGDRVTVTLPDGTDVPGTIASVGKVAHAGSGDQGATVDVTITLRRTRGLVRLDEAPVSVSIARQRQRNVLSVPVGALVGRPGGGFAVEVVRGTTRHLVRVTPGLFGDGYVQIGGVRAGTRVAVPE